MFLSLFILLIISLTLYLCRKKNIKDIKQQNNGSTKVQQKQNHEISLVNVQIR